jgi:hypothetical protein
VDLFLTQIARRDSEIHFVEEEIREVEAADLMDQVKIL